MIAYSKINIREDRIVTMKDDRVFLLTGAAGFLGNNIAKQLMEKGCYIRGLVLKGDSSKAKMELGYKTRPFEETIYDEVEWLRREKRIN